MKKPIQHTILVSGMHQEFIDKLKVQFGFTNRTKATEVILEFCRENEHALTEFFKRKTQKVENG